MNIVFPGGFEVAHPSAFPFQGERSTIGAIVSDLLKYIFPLAGLILLFILIASGFEMLTAGSNPENFQKAKAKITWAIAGFVIIFVAYWLIQIIEDILGITVFF